MLQITGDCKISGGRKFEHFGDRLRAVGLVYRVVSE